MKFMVTFFSVERVQKNAAFQSAFGREVRGWFHGAVLTG
jgi:hypothetical protein